MGRLLGQCFFWGFLSGLLGTMSGCDNTPPGRVLPDCASNADCDDDNACTQDECADARCANTSIEGCCTSDADCSNGQGCNEDAVCEFASGPLPTCERVLLFEDFEACDVDTWVGDCNGWQTWANGESRSAFVITDEHHVSGTRSLQVAGAGSCWEGSTFHPITGRRVLASAVIRASGEGPVGCHQYQNGFSIHPVALWSFDMPDGAYQGGLSCSATGGGSFVAVDGFGDAIGRWYNVAIELNYENGRASFWLDDERIEPGTSDRRE